MILSDKTLKKLIAKGDIHISPFPDKKQFQPSSLDLKLDYKFIRYKQERIPLADTKNTPLSSSRQTEDIELQYRHDPFIIHPNDFILAQTMEYIKLPDNLVGVVEGRSSFGRLGLIIHATAGYVDPGFEGNITLEIKNLNTFPIAIYPEQRICHIVIHELDKNAEYPYGCEEIGSKYQLQKIPTISKIYED